MSGPSASWPRVPLSEISSTPEQRIPGEAERFRYIDISSVDRERKVIRETQELIGANAPSRARKVVRTGDVLVSMTRPNLNAVAIVPPELDGHIASTGFDVLRPKGIDPRWLYYLVRTQRFVDEMSGLVQGALYPAVRAKDVRAFMAPLAPLAEQRRIADKLDRLFAALDTCKARLDAIPAILKRFRQSVLAAATSGQLTEEWRKGRQLESARGLILDAIDARMRRYEQDVLRSRALGSRAPAKPSGIVLRDLQGATLPTSWVWAVPENLCEKIIDGTHHTPTYVGEGVPFLSAKNINGFEVDFDDCKFIAAAQHEELKKRCRAVKGSLLVTKSGTIGRVAVVETDREFSLFESVAVLTPSTTEISAHYLGYVIAHYCLQGDQESLIKGTAVRHLHLEDLRLLRIPLPSAVEQRAIVDRVRNLFKVADELELKVNAARSHLERVTEGLLAKAFTGQLSSRCNEVIHAHSLNKAGWAMSSSDF